MVNALVPVVSGDELDTIQRTGRLLAASGYFDAKGESAQAIAQMAAKILAGRELGFGPFAAVQGIHIIQGRPALGANLIATAVKSSGRYDYRVRELSDKVARIEFFQRVGDKMESLGTETFTAEDARRAGTKNMDKFPRNMLFARAMSNGVRFYCPDVFSGNSVYVPEELGADVDGDGNVVEVQGRRVDVTTGEVQATVASTDVNGNGAHRADLDADVDMWQPDAAVAADNGEAARRRRKLHALGAEVYGVTWDAKRKELVSVISKGRTQSSSDLTPDEYDKLIAGMEAKRATQQPVGIAAK